MYRITFIFFAVVSCDPALCQLASGRVIISTRENEQRARAIGYKCSTTSCDDVFAGALDAERDPFVCGGRQACRSGLLSLNYTVSSRC